VGIMTVGSLISAGRGDCGVAWVRVQGNQSSLHFVGKVQAAFLFNDLFISVGTTQTTLAQFQLPGIP
ncbi:hypothetical protein, partial [Kingella kingae]|uniref:hypothetical protein n=1 Tax=Kingella kingae TaxID=504 RepID=UPI001E545F82